MEYSEVAQIKVFNTFSITDRGVVITGEIIFGEISNGNYFKLHFEGKELIYRIGSIESLRTETTANIGLLINPGGNPDLSYIEKTIGQSIVILVVE